MISMKKGNLLNDNVEALVNTVNCVGAMGKGIALQFKKAFPDNFKAYKKACDQKKVVPGKMFIFERNSIDNPKWIINFPTKRHWKGNARFEDIEKGLVDLEKNIKKLGIKSIAIPPLGSGLGGLDWNRVRSALTKKFEEFDNVCIHIFEPIGSPDSKSMPIGTTKPRMTTGRALIIKLLQVYSHFGYEFTKLEIQKLAYLLQESGLQLKLRYQPKEYGPYADNLNHVLIDMDGHYIHGYGDRVSRSEIKLVPGAIDDADKIISQNDEAQQHLSKVMVLIEGYETPLSMEVLATVHWAASRNKNEIKCFDELVEKVYSWNERKKRIKKNYIFKAYKRLVENKWINELSMECC